MLNLAVLVVRCRWAASVRRLNRNPDRGFGGPTARTLGAGLGITSVAVRKQLSRLESDGLVTYEDRREAVGRPKRTWSLTALGHGRFPDSHSALTVELLGSLRKIFGEAGLERLNADREQETLVA